MRYIQTRREETDVSTALERLFTQDIAPHVDDFMGQDHQRFRREVGYTEAVDDVLAAHLASLANIFDAFAGTETGTLKEAKEQRGLMSFGEWLDFVRDLELIDEQFSARDATIVFVLSRMRVVDEEDGRSLRKIENLSLEDWCARRDRIVCACSMGLLDVCLLGVLARCACLMCLLDALTRCADSMRLLDVLALDVLARCACDRYEALVRVAMLKALPDDAELVRAAAAHTDSSNRMAHTVWPRHARRPIIHASLMVLAGPAPVCVEYRPPPNAPTRGRSFWSCRSARMTTPSGSRSGTPRTPTRATPCTSRRRSRRIAASSTCCTCSSGPSSGAPVWTPASPTCR